MSRNKSKFKQDIQKAFEDAEYKSITSNFEDIVDENDSVPTIAKKMARHTSKIYAEELAPQLSKIIDNYLDSLEFDITKLIAPSSGGTCTGEIKIIK